MIQGMDAAQRAQDRKQPPEYYEPNDDDLRDVSKLSTSTIERITEQFIDELGDATGSRVEELLNESPTNFEYLVITHIAKQYKDNQELVTEIAGEHFWNICRQLAMNAWANEMI